MVSVVLCAPPGCPTPPCSHRRRRSRLSRPMVLLCHLILIPSTWRMHSLRGPNRPAKEVKGRWVSCLRFDAGWATPPSIISIPTRCTSWGPAVGTRFSRAASMSFPRAWRSVHRSKRHNGEGGSLKLYRGACPSHALSAAWRRTRGETPSGAVAASVRARHPGLISTSITDFGRDGPYRQHQGTNMVIVDRRPAK